MKFFKTTHESYHSQLTSETDLRESDDYRALVEIAVQDLEHEVENWLTEIGRDIERSFRRQPKEEIPNIRPQDSISNVSSPASYRTRSSCKGSIRSTTSARAKAAARKAALEVEVEILERLQQLEVEELVLQQRRKQLQLRGEIAAVEAEREVYERAESEARSEFLPSRARDAQVEHAQPKVITPKARVETTNANPTKVNAKVVSNSTPINGNSSSTKFHDESIRKLVEV